MLEDEWVPHRSVLPYPDICKSLPMHGWTEKRDTTKGRVGKDGKAMAVREGEGRFDNPR